MAIGLSTLRAASQRARTGIYGSYIREQEDEATKRHKRARELSGKRFWAKLIGTGVGIGLAPFTGGMSLGMQALIGGGAAGLATYGLGRGKPKGIGPGKWNVAGDILAEKDFRQSMKEQLWADIISSATTGVSAATVDWTKLGLENWGISGRAPKAAQYWPRTKLFGG